MEENQSKKDLITESTNNAQRSKPEATTTGLQWDLDHIVSEDQFDTLYHQIQEKITKFKQYKVLLTPTISLAQFKEIINFSEEISEEEARLACATELMLAADVKNAAARARKNKLNSLSIEIHDATLFFDLWLRGKEVQGVQRLDEKNAKRLFKELPNLKYSLEYGRIAAKHTLKESEELLIHSKDTTGIDVVKTLYNLITNDFTYKFEVPGKEKRIIKNQQGLLQFVHSSDEKEREAAYKALFKPYKKNIDKLYAIYSAVARNWAQEAKLRSYDSSIAMRNFANKIPDAAINTLLKVCQDNIALFQDFFTLKAKLLGKEKLRRYDLYAPLQKNKSKISFEDAQKMVFKTFRKFSPDFAEKAKQIIQEKHLDSHPRENKRSGAFCISITPKITPFVLTNFDGTNQAVSTLAHELGHAVHDLYASDKPYSVSHAPLPLCETASTFAEMVIFETLLENATSNKERQALLLEKIASSYATIIRQNYFILFEIKAHKLLCEGASQQDLNDAYFSLLKEQFGDSVELDADFAYEWAYIPHIFHSPFYCYAYNFGELLSLSLYAMYKKEGKEIFLPKLERILKAGGSEDPTLLLQSIGVDITDAHFWQGGFTIVKNWVKQLG